MNVLHVAPTDSAGGSLRMALRMAGEDGENVLPCLDDFSCGPVSSLSAEFRSRWWGQFSSWYTSSEAISRLAEFWSRLDACDGKLVLWFGRGKASELAFVHALIDRLRGRSIHLSDVTGHQYSFTRRMDGKQVVGGLAQAASHVNPEGLLGLLGADREVSVQDLARFRTSWSTLVNENAPFRIVASESLVSMPADHFDGALLRASSTDWTRVNQIVHRAMFDDSAHLQVGDVLLRFRIATLVEQGRLQADGEPLDNCRVRIPEG